MSPLGWDEQVSTFAVVDEQVDVWRIDGPDESLCLNVDVDVDDSVDRDMVGPVDADVVQQMVFCEDVLVDEFCFEADETWVAEPADVDVVQQMIFSWWLWPDDVIRVEDVDAVSVPQMRDPNELLYDDHDVNVDGWWDWEEVGSADADEVQ